MNGKLLYCHPPPSAMDPSAFERETVASRMQLVHAEPEADGDGIDEEEEGGEQGGTGAASGSGGEKGAQSELLQFGPNVLKASEIVRADPVTGQGLMGASSAGSRSVGGVGESSLVRDVLSDVPGAGYSQGVVDVEGLLSGMGMGLEAGASVGLDLDDPLLLETLEESGTLGKVGGPVPAASGAGTEGAGKNGAPAAKVLTKK